MSSNDFLSLNDMVKTKRIDKRLSQEEVAEYIGVTVKTYRNYEKDVPGSMSILQFQRLCETLDVNINISFGSQNSPKKDTDNVVIRIEALEEATSELKKASM